MKKTETTKNKRRNRNWAKYLDCQRVREWNKNGKRKNQKYFKINRKKGEKLHHVVIVGSNYKL